MDAMALVYGDGGNAVDDPGKGLPAKQCRYVDATGGNDQNDGCSPAKAWKTTEKVEQSKTSFTPGTHILFKRGQSWASSIDFSKVHGEAGKNVVLGAYGLPLQARPVLTGGIQTQESSYVMVRDFDCKMISANNGAHHIVIYNNVVHGNENCGIMSMGKSHHLAIVGNLVYDLLSNDGIVIHQINWGRHKEKNQNSGWSHWIVDNTIIGNQGGEEGIDIENGDYGEDGETPKGDVKVVCNRIQCEALPGLSTFKGENSSCIAAGHDGVYFWFVGNMMTGSQHIGLNLTKGKKFLQASGNIIFNCARIQKKVSAEFVSAFSLVEHNTILHTMAHRAPAKIDGEQHRFRRNLLIRTGGPGDWAEVLPKPPTSKILEMDFNWYGGAATAQIMGEEFKKWQKSSALDTHSQTGLVPGISPPPEEPFYKDPRNWKNPKFLVHFIPDESFEGNAGADTPGAFDAKGRRLGMWIHPMPDLENKGLGWEGPPLVRAKLKELGVSFGETETVDKKAAK